MEPVNKYSYSQLHKMLINKNVHFISDCEIFPNFNIKCKVIEITYMSGEILFKVNVASNGRSITIGSNMKNLQFEVI